MKKRSKLISILIIVIYIVVPSTSLIVNYITKFQIDEDMTNLVSRLSKNDIHVLEIEGRKASAGMCYVQNAFKYINVIDLRIMPGDIRVHNDTLRLILNDNSDVYQGAVMLGELNYVIRNGEITKLREH